MIDEKYQKELDELDALIARLHSVGLAIFCIGMIISLPFALLGEWLYQQFIVLGKQLFKRLLMLYYIRQAFYRLYAFYARDKFEKKLDVTVRMFRGHITGFIYKGDKK